ncbi:MAG: MOSC domain-containing protein [Pseudomonadales bacterium]|nr:MOSC domain-containing protein [Halioglobus sp.]MCP5194965.1 MOSC domain-containing protein [Pseudomonadales bacterium]
MQLSGISIYPVKSCAGINLDRVTLDRFGPVGDRRWLVVDERGRFVSQREQAHMARVRAEHVGGGIRLSLDDSSIQAAIPGSDAPELRVSIWGDSVVALLADTRAGEWLSAELGRPCRLVYMPDTCRRLVDGIYAREGETVSFADGFPLLLISQASLDDLNSRLDNPVPMNRFRPNLVVSGCDSFAEDGWRRIRIGDVEFDVAKPCARCVIPSIDQATAQRDGQINRALASYRRINGQVMFGQNLLYQRAGSLSLGDSVEVLD